jgi:hypothetical protein
MANPSTPADEEYPEIPNYPVLFKHMVLAIFTERDLPRARPAHSKNKIPVRSSPNRDSFDPTKFNAAMDIALAQLKKYGMISERSSRAGITLTSYGRSRESVHMKEPMSATKTRRFDKFYKLLLIEDRHRVNKRVIDKT